MIAIRIEGRYSLPLSTDISTQLILVMEAKTVRLNPPLGAPSDSTLVRGVQMSILKDAHALEMGSNEGQLRLEGDDGHLLLLDPRSPYAWIRQARF